MRAVTPALRLARGPATLAPVILAAACAWGGQAFDRSAVLLSAAPPPQGRSRGAASSPEALPPARTLVDSESVMRSLRAAPDEPTGTLLVSLRFDDQGRVLWARVLEGSLDRDRQQAIASLVAHSVRPQAAAPSWSVRLRVKADAAPELKVGRSELCLAAARPGPTIGIHRQIVVSRTAGSREDAAVPPPSSLLLPRVPRFQLHVDAAGKVLEARLQEGSGDDDVDTQFAQQIQKLEFQPTLLDGQPVSAWVPWPARR